MNIQKGSVVLMKAESGLKGYGNAQCVSWVSHELGELSLYGHNENYKTYHVAKIVEQGERKFTLKEIREAFCHTYNVGKAFPGNNKNKDEKQYFKEKFNIEI